MSQLDVTISLNQLLGLIFSIIIFIYYYNLFLNKYFYNNYIREEDKICYESKVKDSNSFVVIKRILNL